MAFLLEIALPLVFKLAVSIDWRVIIASMAFAAFLSRRP